MTTTATSDNVTSANVTTNVTPTATSTNVTTASANITTNVTRANLTVAVVLSLALCIYHQDTSHVLPPTGRLYQVTTQEGKLVNIQGLASSEEHLVASNVLAVRQNKQHELTELASG